MNWVERKWMTGRGESVALNFPCLLLASTGLRAAAATLTRTWSSFTSGTATLESRFRTSTPPYSPYTHAFISEGTGVSFTASEEAGAVAWAFTNTLAYLAENGSFWDLTGILFPRKVKENLRESGELEGSEDGRETRREVVVESEAQRDMFWISLHTYLCFNQPTNLWFGYMVSALFSTSAPHHSFVVSHNHSTKFHFTLFLSLKTLIKS